MKEVECEVCSKKNYIDAKTCWWCGGVIEQLPADWHKPDGPANGGLSEWKMTWHKPDGPAKPWIK